MSLFQYLENKLLDQLCGRIAYTAPTTVWVGLSTTTPAEDGTNITEPGDTYVRQSLTNNKVTWTYSTSGVLRNDVDVLFPKATASWGTITHFVVFDGSGGSASGLFYGGIDTSVAVDTNDRPVFSGGDLSVYLD